MRANNVRSDTTKSGKPEYGTIRIESVDFAPLFLHIYRNKVCHKTVKWACEPFLSPEDEQEVETAML